VVVSEIRPTITLVELSRVNLPLLLAAAVTDADPGEVMPVVPGPPGWTAERRQAFIEFHSDRALHPFQPVEHTYLIAVGGQVVGAARLEPHGDDVEAGIWIGRSYRGRGIGNVVAAQLRREAATVGAHRIIALTTPDNAAARRLIHTGLQGRTHVEGEEVTGITELR
jgi:RimJ/RimL family protein N-acetyltransferase